MKNVLTGIVISSIFSIAGHSATASDELSAALAGTYGFSGVELFKLDERSFNLVAGDFDSDGKNDIISVDNRSSCLRMFRQQADDTETKNTDSGFVNDLTSDKRFETRQIPVNKQIAGVVAGDFNQDGATDVAYVGTPDRLVVRYQPKTGQEWSKRWSVRLPDLTPTSWMIATGDLDSNGLTDIAVLGKQLTYIIYQQADGMQPPKQLINTSNQLSLLNIADVDADGKADLTYQSNNGSTRSLCVRLQLKDGRLGPEYSFPLGQARSLTVTDVDGKVGSEILTIDSRTGRLQLSKIASKASDEPSTQPLVRYGIGDAAGGAGRQIAVSDIDGDGWNDTVVTDPENAQLFLYRQKGTMGLGTAESFPGLLDSSVLIAADLDDKVGSELIQVSNKEGVISVSQYSEGRITFPRPVIQLQKDQSVVGMTVRKDAKNQSLVVVSRIKPSKSADLSLAEFRLEGKGEWKQIGEAVDLPVARIGSRGADVSAIDVDGDGIEEVLIVPEGSNKDGLTVVSYQNETALIQEPLNVGVNSPGAVFRSGQDLLVARDAFARRMTFADNQWSVEDQFNAGESRAKIVGVAALNLDDDAAEQEVVLIDTGVRRLRVLKKTDGLFRPWKEIELGTFNFQSSVVADLNHDQQPDLLLFGQEQFAVLYSGASTISLEEVSSWEADRDDAYAADAICGDVNGDGMSDILIIDTSVDGVQLVNVDAALQLRSATHFRIFEEKRLVSEATSRGTEPREVLIGDFTGDKLNDVVLLCHDRLLLYPQSKADSVQSATTAEE
ncbi:MAG: VCBS repeat-containing protein [Fuerstiella sp.]